MKNPIEQFKTYWQLAHRKKDPDAYNIYLATVDASGKPRVRTVLLKTLDKKGVGFVTNRLGRKADQLRKSKEVEGCMAWSKLALQVRFSGKVRPMRRSLLQKFWKSRPREAQILYSLGIPQSSVLPGFGYLLDHVAKLSIQWRNKKSIPLSPNYIGFMIDIQSIEFLHHNQTRLTRREYFTRIRKGWRLTILAP